MVNITETHTHCKVPSSNSIEGVQPNNFDIASWARLYRLFTFTLFYEI